MPVKVPGGSPFAASLPSGCRRRTVPRTAVMEVALKQGRSENLWPALTQKRDGGLKQYTHSGFVADCRQMGLGFCDSSWGKELELLG